MAAIDEACERRGRDPKEIERSVNLGFYTAVDRKKADAKRKALESTAHALAQGSLTGLTNEAVDRIGEYERAGAQGLNIAFRPPIDWEAFEAFTEEVLPVFNR
jgi:alkanesulfonate monooxygenase SsuD/methylene tetrahydromethanopterin reductase-like flavin-dependent oxidoreductase (luciferase family)